MIIIDADSFIVAALIAAGPLSSADIHNLSNHVNTSGKNINIRLNSMIISNLLAAQPDVVSVTHSCQWSVERPKYAAARYLSYVDDTAIGVIQDTAKKLYGS